MADSTQAAIDYYVRTLGLSPAQAAGMVNWMRNRESGLDPGAFNPAGGGQGALGIAQWRGPRQQELLRQPDPYSLAGQLAFSAKELQGPESRALDAIKGQSTAAGAEQAFGKYYERPGGSTLKVGGAIRPPSSEEGEASATPFLDHFMQFAMRPTAEGAEGPKGEGEGVGTLDSFLSSLPSPEAEKGPPDQSEGPPKAGGGLLENFLSSLSGKAGPIMSPEPALLMAPQVQKLGSILGQEAA